MTSRLAKCFIADEFSPKRAAKPKLSKESGRVETLYDNNLSTSLLVNLSTIELYSAKAAEGAVLDDVSDVQLLAGIVLFHFFPALGLLG